MTDDVARLPLDPWMPLRSATSARIGLGRSGDASPVKAVLDFQYAHAKARDAVHAALDVEAIIAAFPDEPVLRVTSAAPDRMTYLRRPDLGRRLDAASRARLDAHEGGPYDILFVISDGLSATAIQDHAVPFIHACRARIKGWTEAPLVVATQARVALADAVGESLRARLCATLIGERPGLSVADSLGVYLTYAPCVGRRDSERNCISNIHPHGGLTYAPAADKLVWLMGEALRREVTGVTLKDHLAGTALAPGDGTQIGFSGPLILIEAVSMTQHPEQNALHKSLSAFQLWGIAVGLVISGEYFGWSYGWASAGTLGFLIATIAVAAMYVAFIFSFTELTTAIPQAGGPFAYSFRAFGPLGGFIAGFATLIEFVFAPPAIALAIGAYLHVQFPGLEPKHAALGAYLVFMTLNIVGVGIAATFELFVTILAVGELLIFMGVVAPAFSWSNFTAHGWAGENTFSLAAIGGIFTALPFAIWFFLAIEGVAMAAEEAKEPKRTIPIAYITGVLTLTLLAFGVMIFAGASGDWRALSNINDPLPQAMKTVVGGSSGWLHMLVWLGLFGLVASFHGIIMGYARQIFALSRAGYLPAFLCKIHPRFRTPHYATIAGGLIGIVAIYSDNLITIAGQSLTASIVTISVFGALVMYLMSMASLFRLRATEPGLERPYIAPFYPFAPGFAFVMAAVAFAALVATNPAIFAIFAGIMAGAVAIFKLGVERWHPHAA